MKIKFYSKLIQKKGLHWLKKCNSICSPSYTTWIYDERQKGQKRFISPHLDGVYNSLMSSPLTVQSSQNDATKTCISDHIIMCLDWVWCMQ